MVQRLFILTALLLLTAPAARAGLTFHDDVRLSAVTPGSGNLAAGAGPFSLNVYEDHRLLQSNGSWVATQSPSTSQLVQSFYSFSVDKQTSVQPGSVYDIQGGAWSSQASPRFLSGYAAWVYQKAQSVNPSAAAANVLMTYQEAIWAGMVKWTDSNGNGVRDAAELINAPGSSTAESGLVNLNGTSSFGVSFASLGIDYATFLSAANAQSWTGNSNASEQEMLAQRNGYYLLTLQGNAGGASLGRFISPADPTIAAVDLLNSRDERFRMVGGRMIASAMVATPLVDGAVPEPSSLLVWLLLVTGVAACGLGRSLWRSRANR